MNLYVVYLVRFDGANPIYYVYKQGLIDGFSKNASFWGMQACRLGKRGLIGIALVGVAAEAGAVCPVAGVGVRRL